MSDSETAVGPGSRAQTLDPGPARFQCRLQQDNLLVQPSLPLHKTRMAILQKGKGNSSTVHVPVSLLHNLAFSYWKCVEEVLRLQMRKLRHGDVSPLTELLTEHTEEP